MDDTAQSAALTKSRKSSHVFVWTVENFDTQYLQESTEEGTQVSSPVFEVLHPDGHSITSWIMDITAVDKKKMRAYLRLTGCPSKYLKKPGLLCKFSIHLCTETNRKAFTRDTSHKFTECGGDWGWDGFATSEQLRSNGLLSGDLLHVCVEMTLFAKPESTGPEHFESWNLVGQVHSQSSSKRQTLSDRDVFFVQIVDFNKKPAATYILN